MNKLTEYNLKLERAIKRNLETIRENCSDKDPYWDGFRDSLTLVTSLSDLVYINLMSEESKERRS